MDSLLCELIRLYIKNALSSSSSGIPLPFPSGKKRGLTYSV